MQTAEGTLPPRTIKRQEFSDSGTGQLSKENPRSQRRIVPSYGKAFLVDCGKGGQFQGSNLLL